MLWPRTATQAFLERAAAQLDTCGRALGGSGSSAADSRELQADLVSAYAKQLALLGRLHAQAEHEPTEHALDAARRSALLSLTQDLFDTSLGTRRGAPEDVERMLQAGGAPLVSLRALLLRADDALARSVATVAAALRGDTNALGSDLGETRAAFEAQLDDLRERREIVRVLGAHRADQLLIAVDARRQLIARQLELESWLADWRTAEAAANAA